MTTTKKPKHYTAQDINDIKGSAGAYRTFAQQLTPGDTFAPDAFVDMAQWDDIRCKLNPNQGISFRSDGIAVVIGDEPDDEDDPGNCKECDNCKCGGVC